MKTHLLLRLSMLAILLVSCAPASATATSVAADVEPTATLIPTTEPTLISAIETVPALPAESLVPTPFPVATSRGPELHATDPATVSLASGGIQLVEFFRFT